MYVTFWPIVIFFFVFDSLSYTLSTSISIHGVAHIHLCICVYIFHSLAPSMLLKSHECVFVCVSLVNLLTVFFLSYFYRVFNFHLFLWVIYCRVDDSTITVGTHVLCLCCCSLLAFFYQCAALLFSIWSLRLKPFRSEHS